ncbi:hypothetical protein HQQ82_13605 [Rathayibacter sp. VKM Ac-2856]|uniref:SecDF P1 head subdomain-containing protein n=1 Tax=unclassified Rathayibacter TaxID=2609250 RepID=UPI001565E3F0|nr:MULTISPECIES: hypothetical protein [unclassified Rathayibacter]NQX06036.1 hypothetical protein [Rathayibacter sp. VKM Ac-2858]NQX21014.1 hypothetical protein [Rathayibacter sp. VKM Ac-2856]
MNRHHAAAGAAGILLLALAGCSSPADPPASDPPAPMPTTAPTTTAPTATAAATGGLGVAVTSTCEYGSDPQCLDVAGQYVLVDPAAFSRAGVASVEVTGSDDGQADDGQADDGQAVSVRFDEEGAALFREATAEAAEAGGDARLLLRAGDVVVSAVTVLQEIEGDTVQILPGDEDAQDLADRILAG